MTKYIPHRPTAKQAAFLLLPHTEAFYGGEPGGGKSDALLMGALQYVDVPKYAAILFRRTYADLALPGALMDRSKEWLMSTDAVWNEQRKIWTFPSGATISFGYLESENDRFRYQSAEFQFCGFDELSQFTESQYRYLFSRLRRLQGATVPIRMRGASNPPMSATGQWVREYFVINKSGKHPFIPAGLDDNPYIDRAEYLATLSNLDPATHRGLFDWFATIEGLVYDTFAEGNLTDDEPLPGVPIELAIDDGYVDPRATLFIQRQPGGGILVFDELYQTKTLEERTVQDILDLCTSRGWPRPEIAAVSHEAPALRQRLRTADIPARNWLAHKVTGSESSTRVAAIKATRGYICDMQGVRVLKVHRRCSNLIKEIMQSYRYPEGGRHGPDDMPADGQDHACNALESWVWMRGRRATDG
jgi:hypothetical protein